MYTVYLQPQWLTTCCNGLEKQPECIKEAVQLLSRCVSPQFLDMYGTCLLGFLTDSYQKFHLVARAKFTGVAAPREGIHVEKHTPWTPIILVGNEPILEKEIGIHLAILT